MEKPEDKKSSSDEASHMGRNRSFKSKQLVRSQAIRESQSPPRTVSPAAILKHNDILINTKQTINKKDSFINTTDSNCRNNSDINTEVIGAENRDVVVNEVANEVIVVSVDDEAIDARIDVNDGSSHASDDRSSAHSLVTSCERKKQQVEIQITPGGWEEPPTEQQQRTRRWLGHGPGRQHSRDLLSNSPRVACVCGTCAACPHCRGRRRRPLCPAKQDSGIVCSDECPDCADSERAGPMEGRKSSSLDTDGYCHCPQRKEKPRSITRTDSDEKSEPTGMDLVDFIKNTLNKSGRDRLTLLRIEKELHSLVSDNGRCIVRFPVMSSYGRMLVHRCAALFQLSHYIDHTNKNSVLVSKSGTSGGCLPCTSFKQWCTDTLPASPQRMPDHVNAKSILKRDAHSLESPCAGAALTARSRSLEQRERDYVRVRNKIFNSESHVGRGWLDGVGGAVTLLTADGRNKLLKVQSLESAGTGCGSRRDRDPPPVNKSHSFGGYCQPDPPRMLSRQGDLASSSWRLSPSSSGYRTLSLHSTDSVTPSPTGGASPEPTAHTAHALPAAAGGAVGLGMGAEGPGVGSTGPAVVWAVTDIGAVPQGALVIEPQTGRPLTNPDGSVYRFDPHNPPVLFGPRVGTHSQRKMDQSSEKRRGRLEKQHSFIESSECACQPIEEPRAKCSCETQQRNSEKVQNHSSQKSTQKPQSPCKKRYEKPETPTDHSPPTDYSANQRTAYNSTANQREDSKSFESHSYVPTNPRLETARQYESTNQRQEQRTLDIQRPQSYESQTNQRSIYEPTNHRPNKLTNQESQDYGNQYCGQSYLQTYGNDEVSPPPQPQLQPHPPQYPVESAAHHQPIAARTHHVTPHHQPHQPKVAVASEHPIRPLSLTNMAVYPQLQQYPYQSLVYQPITVEEPKPVTVATSTPHDTTFRIDPSYPYQTVDYGQCGACTAGATCGDPTVPQPRSYSVAYGGVPAALPAPEAHAAPYPITNVFLPQTIAHYPYADPMAAWTGLSGPMGLSVPMDGRLLAPELHPVVPCPVYGPHGYQGHQIVSPQYQVYPTVYPSVSLDQRRNSLGLQRAKRNSISGSSRATPLQTPPDERKQYEDGPNNAVVMATNGRDISRQNSTEIAAKIQQIKDQMAQLSTRDRPRSGPHPTAGHNPNSGPRRDEWRRRNSGTGILGNYPTHHYNARGVQPGNDDSQLSTAARAVVNSIRHLHNNKGAYQSDRRVDHTPTAQPQHHQHSRPTSGDHVTGSQERPDGRQGRNGGPFHYRPPYILRQMSPGTWCRKSPGPIHPALNQPRRPHPDTRNLRR